MMSGRGLRHHRSLDNLRIRNISNNGHSNRQAQSNNSRSHPQLSSSVQFADDVPSRFDTRLFDDNPFNRLAGFFFGMIALVCVSGLLITLTILYVVVRPFSISAYRRLAALLGASAFLDAVALLLPNTKIYLTGDSDVPSPVGVSVLVSNHLLECDWWPLLMLGRVVGLRGSMKVFLRNEVLHLHRKLSGSSSTTSLGIPPVTSNSSTQLGAISSSKAVSFHQSTPNALALKSNASASARKASPILCLLGKLLHAFLEFPLLSGENNKEYVSERGDLFELLRSFAVNNVNAPVHLLLFPENWSLHDGTEDRRAILAKSNDFAKREGRPQLKHLLLPRTTGFNASLEALRESSPVVYDMTMAYSGYDGSVQTPFDLNVPTIWTILRQRIPSEIHIRIKRYSMEEVLQDATWLDKQWAEKDRLLSHFSRHQAFPVDNRGFCRHRVFNTRLYSVELSLVALVRLLILPCLVPIILLLSVPIFWFGIWIWMLYKSYRFFFPGDPDIITNSDEATRAAQTPGSAAGSAAGTPFFPVTPFGSPTISNWRDMMVGSRDFDNDSPVRR